VRGASVLLTTGPDGATSTIEYRHDERFRSFIKMVIAAGHRILGAPWSRSEHASQLARP